jgi:hypothetical protein
MLSAAQSLSASRYASAAPEKSPDLSFELPSSFTFNISFSMAVTAPSSRTRALRDVFVSRV